MARKPKAAILTGPDGQPLRRTPEQAKRDTLAALEASSGFLALMHGEDGHVELHGHGDTDELAQVGARLFLRAFLNLPADG